MICDESGTQEISRYFASEQSVFFLETAPCCEYHTGFSRLMEEEGLPFLTYWKLCRLCSKNCEIFDQNTVQ